jgi:dynein intermediate chain, cytosolic
VKIACLWRISADFWVFAVKELSEEQKQMIILSEDFQRFVLKSGKVMERALSESVDIYTDYIGGSESDEGL